MIARALIVVALVLASAPGYASASLLVLRDAGPVGGYVVRGDGARYIASTENVATSAVTVLDTHTQSRRTLPTPTNCALRDIHHGTLLWNCRKTTDRYGHGVTYDLDSATISELPRLTPAPRSFPEDGGFDAIGDRWAAASYTANHGGSYPIYFDRVTGQQRAELPRADRVVDLDSISLLRRLCTGHRRPTVIEYTHTGIGRAPGRLAIDGRWAAGIFQRDTANGRARIELQRCGARPRTVRVCRTVSCSQPVIGTGILAWIESRKVKPYADRVVVHSLRSGRARRSSWVPSLQSLLLVGSRLYVAAQQRLLRAAL
jgi:hypothetical protein